MSNKPPPKKKTVAKPMKPADRRRMADMSAKSTKVRRSEGIGRGLLSKMC